MRTVILIIQSNLSLYKRLSDNTAMHFALSLGERCQIARLPHCHTVRQSDICLFCTLCIMLNITHNKPRQGKQMSESRPGHRLISRLPFAVCHFACCLLPVACCVPQFQFQLFVPGNTQHTLFEGCLINRLRCSSCSSTADTVLILAYFLYFLYALIRLTPNWK